MKIHLPLTLAASVLAVATTVSLSSCDDNAGASAAAETPAAETPAAETPDAEAPAAEPAAAPAEGQAAAQASSHALPLGAITNWDEAQAAFENNKRYNSYKKTIIPAVEAVRGGADINTAVAADKRYNLLGIACKCDDLDMVAFLLSQGADLNQAPDVKGAVIPYAAAFANPEPEKATVATALVTAGLVDVNADYSQTQSLLASVAEAHNLPLMQLMVEKGADVNKGSDTGIPPLFYALRDCGHNLDCAKFLIDHGARADARDKDGRTVLMYCAAWLSVEEIDFLESKGADLKAVDNEGKSYAMYLCDAGNKPRTLEILKALGDRVDVVTPAKNGMNTIFVAAFHAKAPEAAPLIQYLIERGADPKATWTPTGQTCLHNCVKTFKDKTPEIAEVLINSGADVNAVDNFGLNVAMFCMKNSGSAVILDFLLKHGTDVEAKDKKGQSLWDYAEQYSKPDRDYRSVLEANNVPKP